MRNTTQDKKKQEEFLRKKRARLLEEELLRQTIRRLVEGNEQKTAARRTMILIKDINSYAKKYVDSMVAQKRNSLAARGIKESTERLRSYAAWLATRRFPWAQATLAVVETAQQLTSHSGFWKTPKFINVDEHTEKLKKLQSKLHDDVVTLWRVISRLA